jgi:hypothetical protein
MNLGYKNPLGFDVIMATNTFQMHMDFPSMWSRLS